MGDLDALGRGLVVDGATAGGGRVGLGELILGSGAMNGLLKDGFNLVHVKLGLEVREVVGVAGRVGSAAGVGKVELIIEDLIAGVAPTLVSGRRRWTAIRKERLLVYNDLQGNIQLPGLCLH